MLRLFLLSLSFVLSLLIFQSGFLLKRQELHINSTCLDAKVEQSDCWLPRQYDKIVLLIVDALRYDFLLPQPKGSKESNYQGQMKYVQRLIENGASIGTVLADPPTTTLQRIKAITTGTFPTFIEAGSNFSPDAPIIEDNWLAQAQSLKRHVFFFGDDTWLSLFPKLFTKARGFPSFNINDLHTVDDSVRELLRKQLATNETMDLIIAHVLGVDHCGHKYGPLHPQMGNILRRTDDLIRETASKLNKNDLLIVLGDHGMTTTGDHGGDSFDETHAGILVYSPGKRLRLRDEPMKQIDIVPTLSLLLGLPIPFSNLGTVIMELFPTYLHDVVVNLNYDQLLRFANTYASSNSFAELFDIISREGSSSQEQLRIMSRVQDVLRASWTQFDWPLMRAGLISLLETVLFILSNREINSPTLVVRSGCLFLQLAILHAGAENNAAIPLLMVTLLLSVVYSLVYLVMSIFLFRFSVFQTFTFLACVLHSVTFLSNSFVVYEGHVTRFLLQSVSIVLFIDKILLQKWARGTKLFKAFATSREVMCLAISLIILRLEPLFHRCREEEVGCISYFPTELHGSLTSDMQVVRFGISLISLVGLNFWLYRKFTYANMPGPLRLAWSLSRPALLFTILHQMAAMSYGSNPKYEKIHLVLAQLVYTCSFISCSLALIINRESSNAIVCTIYSLCWSFFLLLGDGLAPALVAFIVLLGVLFEISSEETLPLICSLLLPFGFYFIGHSPTLSAIPWQAAFVGIPGDFYIQAIPALLVVTHICVVVPVVVFSLPVHPFSSKSVLFTLLSVSSIRVLLVCLAAALHRRHLMVWKIFAPKFIFESVSFLFLLVILNVALFLFRNSVKSKV